MASILAKSIVQRASVLLQDVAGVRWSAEDLLGWLNDGQREIVVLRPDAGVVKRSITLAQGALQQLPDDGIRLVDITRNMGADGVTPGRVIRLVEREELDTVFPDWLAAAAVDVIRHYIFDGRYPTFFYVYPGAVAGRTVEAFFQANPVDCTINNVGGGGSDSAISLNDVYQTALIEYLLHRAYLANTDAKDETRAVRHYTIFLQRLGLKVAADKTIDPNRNAPPKETRRAEGGEHAPAF